jgi:Cof subfamily protein (haloacid dehalogenase superfamily)
MIYKLIASDFDDTLYDKQQGISDLTLDTIKRYIASGGRFAIVTGRMFASIIKQAQHLGLKGELIAYQGALICDIETRKIIKSFPIEGRLASEYVKFMQKQEVLSIQAYVDDRLTVAEGNRYIQAYADYCKVDFDEVGDLADFLKNTDKTIHKVFCASHKASTAALKEIAEKEFGDRLLVNSSQPTNVEAVDISTSKGKALKYLCDSYGVKAEDVMAFGDQLNDITLLNYAGFGVAVGNAAEALKEVADYVCEPCIEDGVAKTIQKFCL